MLVRLIFTDKGKPYRESIIEKYSLKVHFDKNGHDISEMTREQFDSLQKAVDNKLVNRIILKP